MNANSSTYTQYKGYVNLKLNTMGVVTEFSTHNAGTALFMNKLAEIVCGYSASVKPVFLDICKKSNITNDFTESVLLQPVKVTGHVYGLSADADNPVGAALCNALVSDSDVNTAKIPSDADLLCIKLLNEYREALAEIKDTATDKTLYAAISAINDSTELLIDWLLRFTSTDNTAMESV